MAAVTYNRETSFKPSETPSIFAVRLIKQHATASMDAEFQRRHPFYGVPADFVNPLPPQLKVLLKNGLRYAKVRWQSRHLEAAGVTQAEEQPTFSEYSPRCVRNKIHKWHFKTPLEENEGIHQFPKGTIVLGTDVEDPSGVL
eukprot:9282880-Pyramimonas_sp.AAC.4